jgi:hypothetical protein
MRTQLYSPPLAGLWESGLTVTGIDLTDLEDFLVAGAS